MRRKQKAPDSHCPGLFPVLIMRNSLVVLADSINGDDEGNEHESTSNKHDGEHFHDRLLANEKWFMKDKKNLCQNRTSVLSGESVRRDSCLPLLAKKKQTEKNGLFDNQN